MKKVVIDVAGLLVGMSLAETALMVPTMRMVVAQRAGLEPIVAVVWAMAVFVVGGLQTRGVGDPADRRCRQAGRLLTSIPWGQIGGVYKLLCALCVGFLATAAHEEKAEADDDGRHCDRDNGSLGE